MESEANWNLEVGLSSQLGVLTKDINLYQFIDRTSFGKSLIGSEMDLAGRHFFNHRFGGGHLWWQEMANRPTTEWPDVLQHLASDVPTKQGIPYLFDASHVSDSDLINLFKLKNMSSSNNWGMINAFDLIAGSVAITFSIYEFTGEHRPYTSDLALVSDYATVVLTTSAGIISCNPILILSAIIKLGSVYKKFTASPFKLSIHPGYFDITAQKLLNIEGRDLLLNLPDKNSLLDLS